MYHLHSGNVQGQICLDLEILCYHVRRESAEEISLCPELAKRGEESYTGDMLKQRSIENFPELSTRVVKKYQLIMSF